MNRSRHLVNKCFASLVATVVFCSCYLGLFNNKVYADYNQGTVTFVTSLYSDCLGRTPDSAGLDDWCAKLASGQMSGKQAAYGFFFSSEFQSKANSMTDDELVEVYYKVFLNREADPYGKSYWSGQIAGTTNDISILFTGFADSTEFANKCDSYGITVGSHVDVPTTTRVQAIDGQSTGDSQIRYVCVRETMYDGRWNAPLDIVDYQYDAQGNLIRGTYNFAGNSSYGDWVEYQYDSRGNVIYEASFNADGSLFSWTRTEYDEHDNETRYQSPVLGGCDYTIENIYDAQGNMIRSNNYNTADGSFLHWTEYQYDTQGNLIRINEDDGGWNEYQYDENGHQICVIAYNVPTNTHFHITYEYDAHGNRIRETDVLHGRSTVYQYDANGNMIRKIDPDGNYTLFEYAPLG